MVLHCADRSAPRQYDELPPLKSRRQAHQVIKWTQQATTLDALDGIPFSFGGDLSGLTSGNPAVTGFQNWELQWNSATQTFTVTGTQQCGNNGCVFSALTPVAIVDASAFISTPISGWANSYGGSINIPPTQASHTKNDAVFYYVQSERHSRLSHLDVALS